MKDLKINRIGGGGVLRAWIDREVIFIMESMDHGRDVQTVAVTRNELLRIIELKED
jgi:hypothetical protein